MGSSFDFLKKLDGGEEVRKYTKRVKIDHNWFSFRSSDFAPESYNPNSAGRFHTSGDVAYYAASGLNVAQAEVPDWDRRKLFQMKEGHYELFDLQAWARDNNCTDLLTRPLSKGGLEIPHRVISSVMKHSVSGAFYDSAVSPGGTNMVIRPLSNTQITPDHFIEIGRNTMVYVGEAGSRGGTLRTRLQEHLMKGGWQTAFRRKVFEHVHGVREQPRRVREYKANLRNARQTITTSIEFSFSFKFLATERFRDLEIWLIKKYDPRLGLWNKRKYKNKVIKEDFTDLEQELLACRTVPFVSLLDQIDSIPEKVGVYLIYRIA